MRADAEPAAAAPPIAAGDRERPWESALRAPFRVVFFPLRLVGRGVEAGIGFVGPGLFEPKPSRPPRSGPSLAPYVTLGAFNDIGIGPALNWDGFPTADSKFQIAGSWSAIDRRRVRVRQAIGDRRPLGLRLRADYDYKPNRRYYGIGNDTPEADLSYFLLEHSSAEATVHFGASPLRQVRLGAGFSSMHPRRGYRADPLLEDVFAPAAAPFMHRSTTQFWYGVSGDLAALDEARDPSRGAHARADVRRAVGRGSADPDYDQWRLEGRAYVPVFSARRVIALRAVYAGVAPVGGGGASLPYYRLAQSEGSTRFAGYASERFRDRQLVVARAEYRWAILYRVSAVALYEWGAVAPDARAFRFDGTHRGYGGGLRLGLTDVSTVRAELTNSAEGLHAILSLGGDF